MMCWLFGHKPMKVDLTSFIPRTLFLVNGQWKLSKHYVKLIGYKCKRCDKKLSPIQGVWE